MRNALAALAALVLPLTGCASSSMEFQEPDAGPAVVGEQPTFQVRTGEATKGGGKAGKVRRADNGGSMSKAGGSQGAVVGQQATGKIRLWDPTRGWGYISPSNGDEDIWFHASTLAASYQAPRENDLVCYVVGRNRRGLQADQVRDAPC